MGTLGPGGYSHSHSTYEEREGQDRERKGRDNCLVFAILNRMVGAGLPEKVTLEERLLGGEGANHADMRGKSILSKRASANTHAESQEW